MTTQSPLSPNTLIYTYTTAFVRDSSISTHTKRATINVYFYFFFLWRNFPCVHVHTSEVPTCFDERVSCEQHDVHASNRNNIHAHTRIFIHIHTIQFVVIIRRADSRVLTRVYKISVVYPIGRAGFELHATTTTTMSPRFVRSRVAVNRARGVPPLAAGGRGGETITV